MATDSIDETGSFEALEAFELVEVAEAVELMRPPRTRELEARE